MTTKMEFIEGCPEHPVNRHPQCMACNIQVDSQILATSRTSSGFKEPGSNSVNRTKSQRNSNTTKHTLIGLATLPADPSNGTRRTWILLITLSSLLIATSVIVARGTQQQVSNISCVHIAFLILAILYITNQMSQYYFPVSSPDHTAGIEHSLHTAGLSQDSILPYELPKPPPRTWPATWLNRRQDPSSTVSSTQQQPEEPGSTQHSTITSRSSNMPPGSSMPPQFARTAPTKARATTNSTNEQTGEQWSQVEL